MNIQYNPKGHSFSGWVGGKSQLARTIVELMPEHKTYVEVFGGAGWVLFKKFPSPVEVINDVNDDLINLYRVLKFHYDAFLAEFDLMLFSRTIFDDMKKSDRGLTDIQRAAKFYFVLRAAFSCRVDGVFSYSTIRKPGLKLGEELRTHLHSVHERLQRVTIENASYDYVIKKMDAPDTLFYLDPPYWNSEDVYGKNIFNKDDFYALKMKLDSIQGKFILSLNDVPEVREIFKGYNFQDKKIRWTINNKAAAESHNGNELIIYNF
ncbi:Dam family site-specific DNA-(adenine-N6)-methyltransferase [Acinetobacter pittii]|uniref:DNA adenine methylase n=1 Tax=Acinetobacter pittii TaxID=48296 RepID=UPI00320AB6E2